MRGQRLTPPEPDGFDVDEQEAELADRLHKEAQEERAWDYFERRDQ